MTRIANPRRSAPPHGLGPDRQGCGRTSPNGRPTFTIPAVREQRPATALRHRLAGSRAIAPIAAAGLAGLLVAITLGAGLAGVGPVRYQAVGAEPSRTPGLHSAAASAPASVPPSQPSPSPAASPTFAPQPTGWRRPPACTALVDVDCRPFVAPTPLPSITAAAGPAFTLHVPIFEYHRVKPLAGETGYAVDLIVPPDIFTAQMDAMARAGWHTITMGRLGDDLRLGIEPPQKTFVITFDDGYEDGYTYALPILEHYGFVATYFVIGGRIGHAEQLTVAEMRVLVAAGNEIGNHTMSHEDLRVNDAVQLKIEIFGASAVIAQAVGVWPQSFSYPVGLTNATVSAAVAGSPGIETAVIQGGSLPETWANRLTLPRLRVGPGYDPQSLAARAARYLLP
jgi:peptidoglycan/xylan/chitin deacetylase (PgdA/CDA1 family)